MHSTVLIAGLLPLVSAGLVERQWGTTEDLWAPSTTIPSFRKFNPRFSLVAVSVSTTVVTSVTTEAASTTVTVMKDPFHGLRPKSDQMALSSSVTTTTVHPTASPTSSKPFKPKETSLFQLPADHLPPLDNHTIDGEDIVSDTGSKQANFTLLALVQTTVALNSSGATTADEIHTQNHTVGLRKYGKDIFLTDLLTNKTASRHPVRYNVVKGRVETDDKASSIHDVLYFDLLRWKSKDIPRDVFYPIWTTDKRKKHVHDNDVVPKVQWKLVLDRANGFYRLENNLDGDWSYCTSPPSIAQEGSVLLVNGHEVHDGHDANTMFESLVFGNRSSMPASWNCAPYGIGAFWY